MLFPNGFFTDYGDCKDAFAYAMAPSMCSAFVKNIHISLICIVFSIASLFCETSGYLQEITHLVSTQYQATCLCVFVF